MAKKKKKIVIHKFLTKKKKTSLKPRITLLSIIVIISLLQGIEINVKNELAIKDYEYAYLLTQLKKQIQENSILYEEVLTAESLTIITQKAKERGFVKGEYIFIIQEAF